MSSKGLLIPSSMPFFCDIPMQNAFNQNSKASCFREGIKRDGYKCEWITMDEISASAPGEPILLHCCHMQLEIVKIYDMTYLSTALWAVHDSDPWKKGGKLGS